MQSSSRIIKYSSVVEQGSKEIKSTINFPEGKVEINQIPIENSKENLESIENIGRNIIEKARRQADEILSSAMEEAQNLETEAYNKGYNTGYEEGRINGYKDSYEANIARAEEEASAIIENANKILFSAKEQYENYLKEKEIDIINLSINIAETVTKKQLASVDGVDEMIIGALTESREAKTFIIRTNSMHCDNIKAKIYDWKERLAIKGEVFVVADDSIEHGNAIIEKDNGSIMVGIDPAMKNIREALL